MNREHEEQALVIQWAELNEVRYPDLKWLFAVPNGDKRHIRVAQRLKKEGVKPGVPDLVLPVPRRGYHGFFIEMKRMRMVKVGKGFRLRKSDTSKEQKEWQEYLKSQGYLVAQCYTAEQAQTLLEAYLSDRVPNTPERPSGQKNS